MSECMKLINPTSNSSIEIDDLPQLEVDKDAFFRRISARKTGTSDNSSIRKSRRTTVKKLNDHQRKRLNQQ